MKCLNKIIGLFNVDSKIPNLALMKISAFFKKKGYRTESYSPLFHHDYHLVFASKIFSYPHLNDIYLRKGMIKGGPGFDHHSKLPFKIDHVYPDYSLYNLDFAMGYITKGCMRNCKFCIVPEMEGQIYKSADLEEFRKDQERVMLLDNNILSYKYHLKELKKLIDSRVRVDFNQGLDIRLITKKNARLLSKIPRWKGLRLRFAFDDPNLKKTIEKKLIILNNAGISNGVLQFYMLIGFNTNHQENMMRLDFLKKKKIAAFVMPFDKTDLYQKSFTRWVNRYFYKYQNFQDYLVKRDQLKILAKLR